MPPSMSPSDHNQHYAMDVVLQRVQALESRVGQLESQVLRLQSTTPIPTPPSVTSSTLSNNPAVSIPTSSNQKTTVVAQQPSGAQRQVIRAAKFNLGRTVAREAGVEAARRATTEQHMRHGGPPVTPSQQLASGWTEVNYARRSAPVAAPVPVPAPAPAPAPALAPTSNHITSHPPHPSTRALPEHRTDPLLVGGVTSTGNLIKVADVAIKVFGKEGHAQAGRLQPSSPKDWQIRIRFQLDPTGAPRISLIGRISKRGPLVTFLDQMGHKTPFATFRINFALKDISEASLELGTVADPMLLPPDVVKQLEDPNEVPSRLRYLAFSWRKCEVVGFDSAFEMPTTVSKEGTALLMALELLKSRPCNAVQIWFLCTDHVKSSAAAVDCIFRAIGRAAKSMYKTYWHNRGDTWVRFLVHGRVVWKLKGIPKSPARIHPPGGSSEKSPPEQGDGNVSMSASIWS